MLTRHNIVHFKIYLVKGTRLKVSTITLVSVCTDLRYA